LYQSHTSISLEKQAGLLNLRVPSSGIGSQVSRALDNDLTRPRWINLHGGDAFRKEQRNFSAEDWMIYCY
jgi:hypothetical protein